MRVSELSRASGVSVPTIKYYLREGLLPPGRATARNQAEYGESHLHRLRLVRALVDVGGLGINAVRGVLAALDDPGTSPHELLGTAHYAVGPTQRSSTSDEVTEALREIDRFLVDLGWRVKPQAPARRRLAEALVALRKLGREVDVTVFAPYAAVTDKLAVWEVGALPVDAPRADLLEAAVVGTVVFEAALVALRKLAHEHHSAVRFGG